MGDRVELTVEQYTEIKTDIAVIKRTLPELSQALTTHMEAEEKDRKVIYRTLLVLGALIIVQILGVPIDIGTIMGVVL